MDLPKGTSCQFCLRKTLLSHGRCSQAVSATCTCLTRIASGTPLRYWKRATSEMSSGSMSTDPGDTWHQGLPMSPQWDGGMELGSDNNNEDEFEHQYENDKDNNYEELDSVAAGRARNYISEVRESSL